MSAETAVAPNFVWRERGLVHSTTIATGKHNRSRGAIAHHVWYQRTCVSKRDPAG